MNRNMIRVLVVAATLAALFAVQMLVTGATDRCEGSAIWIGEGQYICPGEEPPPPPPPTREDPTCPSGQEVVDGRCQPPAPLPEPTPEPECNESCAPPVVQALTCTTFLSAPIRSIWTESGQLSGWWQVVDGSKVDLHLPNGDLNSAFLTAVLENGETVGLQMTPGTYDGFNDDQGELLWYQKNCQRRGQNEGRPSPEVTVMSSQAALTKSEPCLEA